MYTHKNTYLHFRFQVKPSFLILTVRVEYFFKGEDEDSLPVEPCVCVSWVREMVVTAEVIAGLRILKRVYKIIKSLELPGRYQTKKIAT